MKWRLTFLLCMNEYPLSYYDRCQLAFPVYFSCALNNCKKYNILQPIIEIWLLTTTNDNNIIINRFLSLNFPCGSEGKASAYNAGDRGLVPGSGRFPGEGHGNPLQYSCLENPVDRGAWWATVHGVAELDMTEATQHACMHGQGWGSRIWHDFN